MKNKLFLAIMLAVSAPLWGRGERQPDLAQARRAFGGHFLVMTDQAQDHTNRVTAAIALVNLAQLLTDRHVRTVPVAPETLGQRLDVRVARERALAVLLELAPR